MYWLVPLQCANRPQPSPVQAQCVAARPPRGSHVASGSGRSSARTGHPRAVWSARATTRRSSRMLPGQEWDRRTSRSSFDDGDAPSDRRKSLMSSRGRNRCHQPTPLNGGRAIRRMPGAFIWTLVRLKYRPLATTPGSRRRPHGAAGFRSPAHPPSGGCVGLDLSFEWLR